ncbi:MAG: hypothetical protein JNL01_16540 [Bdellovibrionales bacterium]|nr:hypothetical protein [Bdellovibrionales bacterium]
MSHEPEFRGPAWKHPYFLYIVLTLVIFGVMMIMGYLALDRGWVVRK